MIITNRIRRLASEIAKREGKKSNARIGDIREILGILADIADEVADEDLNTELDLISTLWEYAKHRKKKASKKRNPNG